MSQGTFTEKQQKIMDRVMEEVNKNLENITRKDFYDLIKEVEKDSTVSAWLTFYTSDTKKYCIAIGTEEEDGKTYIMAKLAYIPINSAMNEYNYDFIKPYDDKTGEVFDIEIEIDFTDIAGDFEIMTNNIGYMFDFMVWHNIEL